MKNNIKKIAVFSSILPVILLNSCHSSGMENIKEIMFFDQNTNIRYQYVKYEVYESITGFYEGSVETNILDSYQLPDTFEFGKDNSLVIHIPYNSATNNFYFNAPYFTNLAPYMSYTGREFQRRTDYKNSTNSRDDRRENKEPHLKYTNFCLRYGEKNGLISNIIDDFSINIIFSHDFMIRGNDSISYFRDCPELPYLQISFWDMLDNLTDYDYNTFDVDEYIDSMKEQTRNIKENNLIKVNLQWEDGTKISNFEPLVDFDYFYYGPPDPTYEIVV